MLNFAHTRDGVQLLRQLSVPVLARLGAITITGAAMAVLYYGMYGLAREAGYTRWQGALFPALVDGVVFVAYLAAYAFRKVRHRAYAWAIVLAFVGLSALGQYLHTRSLVGTVVPGAPRVPGEAVRTVPDWAPLIATIPALASALALHLAVTLARAGRQPLDPPMFIRPSAEPVTSTDTGSDAGTPIDDAELVEPAAIEAAESSELPGSSELPESSETGVRRRFARGRASAAVPDDARPIIADVIAKRMTVSDAARWAIDHDYTTSDDIDNARKLARRWRLKLETENSDV